MTHVVQTPNFTSKADEDDRLSLDEFLTEVYDYNKSEKARASKRNVYIRVKRYTMHDHGGLIPEEVWNYIREESKDNVDYRNRMGVEFLKGYVAFCKIDHPDIPIPLTGNSHKPGGKYSKPPGTYKLPPEKRKRKDYLCKVHDGTLGGTIGGCRTIMGRVGGIYIPDALAARRNLGISKIVKKGTYDVEEDEGKPLTAPQARCVIEALSNKKIIAICYFMNYTGFRIGEVFTVKKSDFTWDKEKQLYKVRIPARVIKDTITKGWRYLPDIGYEKIRPLLDGWEDHEHPFRVNENQKEASFSNNVRHALRVVYNAHPELCEFDEDNGRYFYNIHSWRARCSTEYARTQGIPDADGYLRHARGLTTYYKKSKEERENAFFSACPDMAIYQVDKVVAESKLKDIEIAKKDEQAVQILELQEQLKVMQTTMELNAKKSK